MTGFSVFYKDEAGVIFHTYSTYARGTESFLSAYDCPACWANCRLDCLRIGLARNPFCSQGRCGAIAGSFPPLTTFRYASAVLRSSS